MSHSGVVCDSDESCGLHDYDDTIIIKCNVSRPGRCGVGAGAPGGSKGSTVRYGGAKFLMGVAK